MIPKARKAKSIVLGEHREKSAGENEGWQRTGDNFSLRWKTPKDISELGDEQKSKSGNGRGRSHVWQRALHRTKFVLNGSPQNSSSIA